MINLNDVTPNLKMNKKVAIIGSSASLLEKENGKLIDEFDEVVRFNRAPTVGYEKYVGSKSTIYVANPHVFACIPWGEHRWSSTGQPTNFIRDLKNMNIIYAGIAPKYPFHKHAPLLDSSSKGFKFIKMLRIGESGFKQQPTVGIIFIKCCIQSGMIPHIFGFDGIPGEKEKKGLTHYWEERDNKSIHHHYPYEREVIQHWADKGFLKLRK